MIYLNIGKRLKIHNIYHFQPTLPSYFGKNAKLLLIFAAVFFMSWCLKGVKKGRFGLVLRFALRLD